MKTYTITKNDLDKDNFYVGETDLTNFDGQIESDPDLGTVKFKDGLKAKFGIWFDRGSGIKAGWEIEAGGEIKAGAGIKAGSGIAARTISAKLHILAGTCIWKIPTGIETEIRVEKVLSGTISHGTLVLTKPKKINVSCEGKIVEIDGRKYKLTEV